MTKVWLVLLAAALAAPARADETRAAQRAAASNGSAAVGQDPLTRQILRRQLLHPNGGVETVVRLGSGEALKLQSPELGTAGDVIPRSGTIVRRKASQNALSGLKAHPDLLKARRGPGASGKTIKKAPEQLEHIERTRQNRWVIP